MYAVALVFFVAVGFCSGIPLESGNEWNSKIIGGQNASIAGHPYLVSLRSFSNRHYCSGSILTNRTIITAAHCIRGRSPTNIVIVAGSHLLSSGGVVLNTFNYTIHPDYSNENLTNDIGLIMVDADIEFTNLIQPVALGTNYVVGGTLVQLSGWGSTTYPGNNADWLQVINLRTISVNECVDMIGSSWTVFNSSLCTFTRVGEGACNGDSGSPLISNGTLVGMLSWGSPCARGLPDVYSRISSYIDWIDENII